MHPKTGTILLRTMTMNKIKATSEDITIALLIAILVVAIMMVVSMNFIIYI